MKPTLFFAILFCLAVKVPAQNLVSNGNFEQYSFCPTSLGQSSYSNGWSGYTVGTPDYFNACGNSGTGVPSNTFGYQAAISGAGYVGLFVHHPNNYREYLKTNISQLQPGYLYEVSMYVSLADGCSIASNGLGVYFYRNSPPLPSISTVLPVTPQISYNAYGPITNKISWTKVTATFTADSAYNRAIIGSFVSNTNATTAAVGGGSPGSYYYIDSVEVKMVHQIIPVIIDTVYCVGDSIHVPFTITTQSYYNNNNIFALQLSDSNGSFNNATTLGTATTTQINAAIPGNIPAGSGYRIRIAASSPYNIGSINTGNIIIKKNPALFIGSNSPVCAGDTLTMQAATNATTCTWMGSGNSFTGNLVTISNADTTHTDQYIVTAILNGCSTTDTLITTVHNVPATPSVTSNSPVCFASSVLLSATCGTSNVTFNWVGPNSFSTAAPLLTINNATTANQGLYIVTASKNNCTSMPDTVSVLVNPEIPKPVGTNNSPICVDETLLLAASGAPGVIFQWDGVNQFSSNNINPSIQKVSLKNDGLYTLKALFNGCYSEADSISVVVNPLPTIYISAIPGKAICASTIVKFSSNVKHTHNTVAYQWYKNARLISAATGASYTASNLANNDAIYCIMYTQDVCGRPQVSMSDTIIMNVADTTSPKAVVTSNPSVPIAGQQDDFTVHVKKGGTSTTYQWQVNGISVAGASSATWSSNQLNANDRIDCIITSPKTCLITKPINSDTLVVKSATLIKSVSAIQNVTLYPNPANGSFTINGIEATDDVVMVDITNNLGQVAYTNSYRVGSMSTAITVNVLGTVAAGNYIVNIHNGNLSKRIMLTIQ